MTKEIKVITPEMIRQIVATDGLEEALFYLRYLHESDRWRVSLYARSCALHIDHLWKPSQVMTSWLLTGDESLRNLAKSTAVDVASRLYLTPSMPIRCAILATTGNVEELDDVTVLARRAVEWAVITTVKDTRSPILAGAAWARELSWQTEELMRVMSLDYSPEVLILKMPEEDVPQAREVEGGVK